MSCETVRPNPEFLHSQLHRRLACNGSRALEVVRDASEVIVFGSFSAGLERPWSDIDVLCIGGRKGKIKSASLDLIIESSHVTASTRSLERSWDRLENCFRAKYALKLRRETQRLCLLERNLAIPPTRLLDQAWSDFGGTTDVC